MARTQAADYEEKRDFIVARSFGLFAAHGFHATSITDMADACGLSKTAMYHYFPSKEDVLFTGMWDHVTRLLSIAKRISGAAMPPNEKIRFLCHEYMQLYVSAQAHHRVLLNELGSLPSKQRRQVIRTQRQVIDLVATTLAELNPRLARRKDRRVAATMMLFGIINWTHTWFDPKGPIDAETFAEMAATFAEAGVASL